jgi:hypothetical protein
MKKPAILFSLILLLLTFYSANAEVKGNKKILGTWAYSAPSAPYPYSEGTIILKEVDNKLTGEFNIQGEKITAKEVIFANDEVTLKFEVEYEPITAKLKLVKGELVGSADSPDGPITVKAIPKK